VRRGQISEIIENVREVKLGGLQETLLNRVDKSHETQLADSYQLFLQNKCRSFFADVASMLLWPTILVKTPMNLPDTLSTFMIISWV